MTPVVALLITKDDHVLARLGTGSALTSAGAVAVNATHINRIFTEGNAEAAGKDTAVGIDISINVVVGWDTTAESARNVTAASVEVLASSDIRSEAKAVASAKGSSDSDTKSGDENANSQVNGDNPNTKDKGTGALPSSSGGTDTNNGTTGANSKSSSESGSGGGGTGVAGAIAVNWVVMTSSARITADRTVTATTGAVTVRALSQVDATARAMGSAIDLENDTGVGAAVGLNVQDLTNTASIGTDAVVNGNAGVTVEAITPDGQRNDFIVWGIAAGGGKNSAGVAASVGVQILLITTTASVGKGAQLDSAAGGITVRSTETMGLQIVVVSGGFSTGSGTAVGGAVAVNYLEINTAALIDSGTAAGEVTKADAAGALSVTATTTLVPLEPETPLKGKITLPSVTSVAVGAGASNSGAAVSGSFIIDVMSFDTRASIGNGALVNQEGAVGGAGQTVTVHAEDNLNIVNVSGALSFSASSAAVGLTAIVEIVNSNVRAWIGSDASVRAGGSVTVEAKAVDDWFELSVAGGVSGSSAAVTGAVLVFVFNQGSSNPQVLASIGSGATVHALGAVDVLASRTASGPFSAGNLAISGGSAGVGASAVVIVRSSVVEAMVGANADIQAGGTGLTVSAIQSGDFKFLAVGGAGGSSAGVAGSVVVDVLTDITKAHIDSGASVNMPSTSVTVFAQDTTTVLSLAGVLVVGGSAGVGAGVDVEVITKTTEAWIATNTSITGTGNLTVDALSSENITSISVGGGFAGSAAVNVNAAVSVLSITTRAYIADGTSAADAADVVMGGSVRVNADEALTLNVIGGNIAVGGSAGVGAAVAVPVTTKDTHAWIGNFARVSAKGDSTVTVATGSYSVTTKDMRFAPADVNTGTDTITLANHGFQNGDQVQYDRGCDTAGCEITGLTHRGLYYIVNATPTTFQVSATPGGASVDLQSQGTTENQRFFSTTEANVQEDNTLRFNPQTAVSGGQITTPYSVGAADDGADVVGRGAKVRTPPGYYPGPVRMGASPHLLCDDRCGIRSGGNRGHAAVAGRSRADRAWLWVKGAD